MGVWEVGSATLTGSRYGPELNQDWSAYKPLGDDSASCWAGVVLDGHGMLGEEAARVGGELIMAELSSRLGGGSLDPDEDGASGKIEKVLLGAFRKAHNAILALYESAPKVYEYPKGHTEAVTYTLGRDGFNHPVYIDGDEERLLEFGATATAVVRLGDRLFVAQVGDSACALGRGADPAEVAMEKHSGLNPKEADRISQGGKLFIDEDDGYVSCTTGPWAGSELGMTRCLGQRLLGPLGVTPDPEVREVQINGGGLSCVVVASDGVWDAMAPGEAAGYVEGEAERDLSAVEIARGLVKKCVNLMERTDGSADNTTAIVVLF